MAAPKPKNNPAKPIKIAVINPPRVNGYPVCREDRLEYIDYGEVFTPLTLLYTAAVLEKKGYKVMAVDANGFDLTMAQTRQKMRSFKPDILLTRFAIDTIPQDSRVITAVKKINPKCITLVRSKIISDSPLLQKEVFGKYPVDFLITGDMEVIVPGVAKALAANKNLKQVKGLAYRQNGKTKTTGTAPRIKDINQLPYPAYHLSGGINCYQTGTQRPPFTNVFSSRGCPFSCKFCSSHDSYQARTPTNVVDELEWLVKTYNLKNFYFFDDIFTIHNKRAYQICQQIIKRGLKLRWSIGTRLDCVDLKLLRKMRQAGCWMIAYGVESGVQKILDRNQKGFKLSQVKKTFALTKQAGIFSYAMMVLGLPGETKATIRQTFRFIDQLKPDYVQYCVAVPFPNTPFFDEYKKKGWITTYDWTKYNPLGFPVISTPEFTAEELNRYRYQAYRRFLFRPGFLLSRLSWHNWRWNLIGAKFLFNRTKAILNQTMIR